MPSRSYYVAHLSTKAKNIWARLVAFLRSLGRKS